MEGFVFKYMFGGGVVYLTSFIVAEEQEIRKGQMCTSRYGRIFPARSGDALAGVAANDAVGGEIVKLYPQDAVYAVKTDDASAERYFGQRLYLASGAMGVAEMGLSHSFDVVRNAQPGEDILVRLSAEGRAIK